MLEFNRQLFKIFSVFCIWVCGDKYVLFTNVLYNCWSMHIYVKILYIRSSLIRFLGHLSHSGDILLWVGVRCRPSCVVRRAFTFSSLLPGIDQTNQICRNDDQGSVYQNCKLNYPRNKISCAGPWPFSEHAIYLLLFLSTLGHGSDKLSIKQWWPRKGLPTC